MRDKSKCGKEGAPDGESAWEVGICVEEKKKGYRRGGAREGDGHAISAALLLITALRYVVVWSLILAIDWISFRC